MKSVKLGFLHSLHKACLGVRVTALLPRGAQVFTFGPSGQPLVCDHYFVSGDHLCLSRLCLGACGRRDPAGQTRSAPRGEPCEGTFLPVATVTLPGTKDAAVDGVGLGG